VFNFNPPFTLHSNWDIEPQRYWGHDLDLSGHVTSSVMWPLDSQGVVSYWTEPSNRPCVSHGCWNIELQRYRGHDLDLLGSRDVICHVTIGFAIWGFQIVVNMNRSCISHGLRALLWYSVTCSRTVVTTVTSFDVVLPLVWTASTATVSALTPVTHRDAGVEEDVLLLRRRLDSTSTSRCVLWVSRRLQLTMMKWGGQSVDRLRPVTPTNKR